MLPWRGMDADRSELKHGGYGFTRMRYRGLSRCSSHLDLAIIACNLRRVTA